MSGLRKRVYDSWLGQQFRTSRLGVATLEGVAGILRLLPVPKHIFDPENDTWRKFHYFDHGRMSLPVSLDLEFESLLANNIELSDRVARLRERCPRVGMVFSSGRAGTRGFSLFLDSKDGLTALHRPGDVAGFEHSGVDVDPGLRNTVVYGLMMGPRDETWWRQHAEHVVSMLEFAASLDTKEFWLTAHRWNCYFPMIELVLARRCPAILLDRTSEKIIHSMISRNQYCPATAIADQESTWVNIEPQLAETLEGGAGHLRMTTAPLFDRVCWYVSFVRYWFDVCTKENRCTDLHAVLDIDDLAAHSVDSYQLIDRVVGLAEKSPEHLLDHFRVPKNVKPRSTQTGLRFPAIERWTAAMNDRKQAIAARWNSTGPI